MALVRLFQNDLAGHFARMQREMDRLWSATWSFGPSGGGGVFPATNIYDDGESFIVRAELPGVKPEDIDINVTGRTLNVRGKREIEPANENLCYHRRERRSGEFRRAVDLPDAVDADKVVAKANDGVLEILLPRADSAKQRKVKVNAD